MTREVLPNRRLSVTFSIPFWGQPWNASAGFMPEGKINEVFISAAKTPGSELDCACRDCAILISLALQHGCPLELMSHAITRNADGSPSGIAGAVIDKVLEL